MALSGHRRKLPRRHGVPPRAFTLVELLVVIGIVTALVAVLLPTLMRARRKALVLACPIAYQGKDASLHLAGPSGADVDMGSVNRATGSRPFVTWSPDGLKIAYETEHTGSGDTYGLSILEPLSGERRLIRHIAWGRAATWHNFRCWADSNHIVLLHQEELSIVNIHSNTITASYPVPGVMKRSVEWISPLPPTAKQGRYVINFGNQERQSTMVALLRKDFNICKVIWEEPAIQQPHGGTSHISASMVKVDPMGEWVAWTHWRSPYGVAIKRLTDHARQKPALIAPPRELAGMDHILFCDWTEDGNLLVSTGRTHPSAPVHSDWHLMIIDKQGRPVRKLWNHTRPAPAVHASWRKYGHW